MSARATLKQEIRAMRRLAEATPAAALREGGWLDPVVEHALGSYALLTTRDGLAGEHPRAAPPDGLADARIVRAQRYAMVAGALSAGAYASVVMGAIATGGAAAVAALPAAAAAFATDLYVCTTLQLRLAWDLATVYEHRPDLDDPQQRVELVAAALGLDVDGDFGAFAAGFVPELSRLGGRSLTTGTRLAAPMVPLMGRFIVQRGAARFAMPGLGVPICAAVNHVTTGATGRATRDLFRRRAHARGAAADLDAPDPLLLLAVVSLALRADGKLGAAEAALLDALGHRLGDAHLGDAVSGALQRDETSVLAELAAAPEASRRAAYEAAVVAVTVDGRLDGAEHALLHRVAHAARVPHDPSALSAAVQAALA